MWSFAPTVSELSGSFCFDVIGRRLQSRWILCKDVDVSLAFDLKGRVWRISAKCFKSHLNAEINLLKIKQLSCLKFFFFFKTTFVISSEVSEYFYTTTTHRIRW